MGEYDSALQEPSPHDPPLDPERIDTEGVVFVPVEPEPQPPGDWRTDWANSPEAEAVRKAQAPDAPATEPEAPTEPTEPATEPAPAEAFDPGAATVDEVVAHVQAHPDELDAVYAAEQSGKARSTLLSQLDGLRPT